MIAALRRFWAYQFPSKIRARITVLSLLASVDQPLTIADVDRRVAIAREPAYAALLWLQLHELAYARYVELDGRVSRGFTVSDYGRNYLLAYQRDLDDALEALK